MSQALESVVRSIMENVRRHPLSKSVHRGHEDWDYQAVVAGVHSGDAGDSVHWRRSQQPNPS
jgi:hypothetical protein